MQDKQQEIIANTVKKHRIAMGYTQQELADVSNISLRSIQRIEKGQVTPRMHTLKVLAKHLGFSIDILNENDQAQQPAKSTGKIFLYVGAMVILVILALAYLAQSSNFPETTFELLIFLAVVISGVSLLFYKISK
ncbi:helix-turn-helix domain-containing protein [Rasiella sp. SM2506]|uniref:helix-turn-helix domain-containing protein n=1 Tax=Rasiella sp. SM2506 TaxID=3423914 RepID=UPI003D7A46CB